MTGGGHTRAWRGCPPTISFCQKNHSLLSFPIVVKVKGLKLDLLVCFCPSLLELHSVHVPWTPCQCQTLPHPTLHTCPTWLLLKMFIHSFLKHEAPTIYCYQALYQRLVAPDFHSPYQTLINLDSPRICYMQTRGPG